MSKYQYVVWGHASQPRSVFKAAIEEQLVPGLLAAGVAKLKLTIAAREPPRWALIPFGRVPVVLISVWGEEASAGDEAARLVTATGCRAGGYRVSESTPRAYQRDWPDGEETPGVGLLTLFNRKRGLSDEGFIARWHGSHTPLSLRIHPLWSYLRNEIEATMLDGSPRFDAIVEEHFAAAEDLLRPTRFFGGAWHAVPNMARVAWDISRLIDLGSMETYLASEYHLRS